MGLKVAPNFIFGKDLPFLVSRSVINASYSWLYDALSGRTFNYYDFAYTYNLVESGNVGISLLSPGSGAIRMPIYERPTKSFKADWAKDHLTPGQTFRMRGLPRKAHTDKSGIRPECRVHPRR